MQESCKIALMNDLIVLDAIDRRILRVLQEDGRATYDVLAQQVGLSPSAVLRRAVRVKVVVASFMQPAAAYPLLSSVPRRLSHVRG